MKTFFILGIAFFISINALAQRGSRVPTIVTTTPGVPRIENDSPNPQQSRSPKKAPTNQQNTPLKRIIRSMNIMPLGIEGGLLSNINSDDDFIYLHTEAYNKNIENQWSSDFKISEKFDYIGEQFDSTFHFALFNQFQRKNQVVILKTSIKTGIRKQIENTIPEGMKIITFRVVNEDCFLACSYKDRPVVVLFDTKKGTFKTLPNLLDRNAKFLALYADNQIFTVVLKQMGTGDLFIKKYSKEGKLLKISTIPENKCHYNEAKIVDTGDNFLVVGTYSRGWRYKLDGIFVATVNQNFTQQSIKLHKFNDLIGSFSKVSPYAVSQTLRKTNDGIIGGFELFDANIINQDYAGRIKYSNSLIFKLDTVGNFIWKNVIPMPDVENFIYASRLPYGLNYTKLELLESNVKPLIKVLPDKEVLICAYQSLNTIKTITLNSQNGEKIAIGQYQERPTEHIIGFSPWYESNFLLWGRQRANPLSATNLYMRKVEVSTPH